MQRIRRKHSAEFKAKVALEAIREAKTTAEIGNQHGVHAIQVTKWKKEALEGLSTIFERGNSRGEESELIPKLYQQIGEQKVALDWLKKKLGASY